MDPQGDVRSVLPTLDPTEKYIGGNFSDLSHQAKYHIDTVESGCTLDSIFECL